MHLTRFYSQLVYTSTDELREKIAALNEPKHKDEALSTELTEIGEK